MLAHSEKDACHREKPQNLVEEQRSPVKQAAWPATTLPAVAGQGCPCHGRIDRSMPEKQGSMPTIDHSMKNMECSMSAIERSMKKMEHFIPAIERSIKKMEHFIPLIERSMKKMECSISLIERSIKNMERFIPTIDASVKNMKRSSLAMNHSLPTTEGFSTDRERFANLGQFCVYMAHSERLVQVTPNPSFHRTCAKSRAGR
jgi:hypothetical protein